ncbi:MAG: ABC transporter substrate-binding protein [Gemmatimonadota bacterium]
MRKTTPAAAVARRTIRHLVAVLAAAGLAACGSGPEPVLTPPPSGPPETPAPPAEPRPARPTAPATAENCLLTGVPARTGEILRVGVTEPVDPAHVPIPRNGGERLVFRHLYETLVRLDCRGTVRPALADEWASPDGRTWTFRIRRGARFWDGSPVTAADVVASWSSAPARIPAGRPADGEGRAALEAITDARALDERRVRITLGAGRRTAGLFAASALAVYRTRAGSAWPLGTGRYGIRGVTEYAPGPEGRGRPGMLTLQPTGDVPGLPPAVQFLLAGGEDARDLLEGGVDVLIARDPAAVEYAITLPGYRSSPLLWDRTEVLLAPALRPAEGEEAGHWSRSLAGVPLEGLARDAVRAEARPTRPPHWWEESSACRPMPSASGEPNPSGSARAPLEARIVYRQGNRTARDIAERLVALAGPGRTPGPAEAPLVRLAGRLAGGRVPLRTAALDDPAFASALRRGLDAGYILSVPRRVDDACAARRSLLERAPWILAPGTGAAGGFRGVAVPLVDTRARAVVRKGLSGLSVAWDGTVLVFGGEPGAGGRP